MSDQLRIVRAFATDCVEVMDQLDHDLAALEKEPGNQECLGRIAEVLEIIRTDSARLGLPKLQAITDAGCKLLRKLQSGIATSDSTINTALLAMVDAMRQLLGGIEQQGREGEGDFTGLVEILLKLQETSPDDGFSPRKKQDSARRKRSSQRAFGAAPSSSAANTESLPTIEISEILSPKSRILTPPGLAADSSRYRPISGRIGGSLVRSGHIRSEDLILALREQESGDRRRIGEILVGLGLLTHESLQDVLRGTSQFATPSVVSAAAAATIPVCTQVLDQIPRAINDLAGVLHRLTEWTSRQGDPEGRQLSFALHQAFGVVQQRILQTRLQSLNVLTPMLQRAVHEAAGAAGKKVNVVCTGEAAEVDQTILRALEEPLVALVRNLVDRVDNPAEATLELRFDKDAKEASLCLLAEAIEEIDVAPLQAAVEAHRGTASICPTGGGPSRLRLTLPLPATWIASLLIESTGEKFAVRRDVVHELVHLDAEQSMSAIEMVKGSPFLWLRQAAIPLVDLRRVLHAESLTPFRSPLNVVVVRTGERSFGLLADRIDRFETLLIEPRVDRCSEAEIFAGSAELHDGSIALLLNTERLARQGGALPAGATTHAAKSDSANEPVYFVMEAGERRRFALLIEPTDRMEAVMSDAIQLADGEETLLRDGDIVPLFRISSLLGLVKTPPSAQLQVVFRDRRHSAVMLDLPGEILRTSLQIKRPAKTFGIKGSAVVRDRVIDVIDLDAMLDRYPNTAATT